jgi:hypothetical protein
VKFNKGDLVLRRADVFDERSRLMTGTVTDAYNDYASRFGPYPELYEVTWDDGSVERGYLPHGLSPAARGERTH